MFTATMLATVLVLLAAYYRAAGRPHARRRQPGRHGVLPAVSRRSTGF